ncbi:hypothetical protein [Burkholderia stagnalis]|uniref:hypothetical protein n=1 Tax=Burkholderia stagnalis TaxID=1503054 RepID=UPI000F5C1A20|nr:hypothetical protein [Burkholderia stagnalis]RQP98874.1 hypothetical protein DF164_31205 [Burkholderia stagnalis]RQY64926.1 hypothetical protein DF110_30730 [Burkholderia stagnalis]
MGGDFDYGGVQQPSGPYGGSSSAYAPSQNAPSSYQGVMQKGAGPAPTARPPLAANAQTQPSPDAIAGTMVDTLAKIYAKHYSKKHVTLGPKVGKKIAVKLVEDSDMATALTEQAENIAADIVKSEMKFNPQRIMDELVNYYRTIKEPFPDRLKTIDENTSLTAEEQGALFGFMKSALVAEVRKDVDNTQGFFDLPRNAGDDGTIFIRAEFAKSVSFQSDLAGTIAHELAHAYADEGWRDFLRVMTAMGMLRTGQLAEGMATFIEDEIVSEWLATQPAKTLRPPLGYTDDPEVADSANSFIKAVGRDLALTAFFGGWINFANPDKPQDTIVVGRKAKKKWKWPWR